MNREVCKFLSGAFGALAYVHAAYAVATSRGIINEPEFLGKRWGVGSMWTEAAAYTAIGAALGYAGWGSKSQPHRHDPAGLATRGQDGRSVSVGATA